MTSETRSSTSKVHPALSIEQEERAEREERARNERSQEKVDSLADPPPGWNGDYDRPPPELRLAAKLIIRALAEFGSPEVTTDGFGRICLGYHQPYYMEIWGFEHGTWELFDGYTVRTLGSDLASSATLLFRRSACELASRHERASE